MTVFQVAALRYPHQDLDSAPHTHVCMHAKPSPNHLIEHWLVSLCFDAQPVPLLFGSDISELVSNICCVFRGWWLAELKEVVRTGVQKDSQFETFLLTKLSNVGALISPYTG